MACKIVFVCICVLLLATVTYSQVHPHIETYVCQIGSFGWVDFTSWTMTYGSDRDFID